MAGLAAHGDGLHFEVAAAEKGARTNESTRWKILCEVCFIGGIEFVVVGQVGAEDLHVDEIVHGHAGSGERSFVAIEQELDFILDFLRRLASLRIESDAPRQVEGVSGKNSVAEGCLDEPVGQVDGATRGLR